MKIRLLDLISTPIPVLDGYGLDVAVGLSSEDPIGGRRASEPFAAFLTTYAADGRRLDRADLGDIPASRRRMIDVTAITRARCPGENHLVVAHRVPRRLLDGHAPEDVVELTREDAEFAMYRSLVQYSVPGGGNGSVIYETPPGLNTPRPGRPGPTTLTFTSKVIASEQVTTAIVLMNYSLDPAYAVSARYRYAIFAPDGAEVAAGTVVLPPFTVRVVDVRDVVPARVCAAHVDPADGLTWMTYVGYCRDTVVIPLIVTLAPALGAVAVEHTHPAQAYTLPARPEDKHKVKSRAVAQWAARWETQDARA